MVDSEVEGFLALLATRRAPKTVEAYRRDLTALAADTVSIVIMEAVDNVFVLIVPGAIDAGLGDAIFWWSIVLGFAIAFAPAWAANRWLIARGKGHAVVHQYHQH